MTRERSGQTRNHKPLAGTHARFTSSGRTRSFGNRGNGDWSRALRDNRTTRLQLMLNAQFNVQPPPPNTPKLRCQKSPWLEPPAASARPPRDSVTIGNRIIRLGQALFRAGTLRRQERASSRSSAAKTRLARVDGHWLMRRSQRPASTQGLFQHAPAGRPKLAVRVL
jgi:hypothetical protein